MKRAARVRAFTLVVPMGFALSVSGSPAGAQGGGSIVGEVKFVGEAPGKTIQVNKDAEVCGAEQSTDELVVGPNKGVMWAVVSLPETKGPVPDASKKAALDQSGRAFKPRVVLVPAGGSLDILNDDGVLHNIHTFSTANPSINEAQPKFKKVMTRSSTGPSSSRSSVTRMAG